MIYIAIENGNDLQREFQRMDRDYYSYEAYEAMIQLFEDESFELDVIALCCDFNEDTEEDIINNYSIDVSCCIDNDERLECIKNYLDNHAGYYRILDNGNIFYQVF